MTDRCDPIGVDEVEGLLFRNILGRLAKTLYDLSQEVGEPSGTGISLKESYTHQELADLVGTSREPLTRALASLKRAQLIELRGGRLFITDVRRLADISGESVSDEK